MTCRHFGIAAFVLLVLATPPLWPCAPSIDEIAFWYGRRPGPEIGDYLAGELGVLDRQFARYYLFVAYRYLTGLGLTEEDQERMADPWRPRAPSGEPVGVERWLQVRNAVPGVEPLRWILTEKSQRVERRTDVFYAYYRNCLDDAFETAAATLGRYVATWGPASRETRSWLEAQDQVFANCGGGESVLEPLDATWEAGLREDRLYQVAAAHFYAGRYEEARQGFARIAADPSSARRSLAHYLLGRILIREDRLAEAAAYFRALVEDPEQSDFHASARGLLEHIGCRLEPAQRRREIAPSFALPTLPERWRQLLIDDFKLLEPPVEVSELGDEMAEWIRVVGWPSDSGRDFALARWEEKRTLPWLVASLVLAEPSTPQAAALIQEGAAVAPSSPAFLTSSYHRFRLLAGQGRLDGVREELDQRLASQALSPSDRNRFQTLRSRLASDLDEYAGLTQQVAQEIVWDGGYVRTDFKPGKTLPLPELVNLMNRGLVTGQLVDLVRRGVIVPELRRRIVLAAWTRALVLGDEDARRAAEPLVRELVPELAEELQRPLGTRGGLLQALDAASDDERPFVAALGLLRFPGLHPDVHTGLERDTPIAEIDSLRANWWCPGSDLGVDEDRPLPAFVDPDAAAEDRLRLRALPAGPIYLGRIVVDWADRHREDPRVPEALHLAVRATRFGCPLREGGYGEISRQAFERLHQRYPGSSWAAKTKYWFE